MQTLRDFSFGEDDPAIIEHLARLYAVEKGPLGQGSARHHCHGETAAGDTDHGAGSVMMVIGDEVGKKGLV